MLLTVAVLVFSLFPETVSAKALAAADGQTGAPDYTCSPTKPCALGCCGKNGICGMGPDYCSAANCVNSCDAKSECDPANWGPQYAAHTKCPLNVCCSKYGFCGTTEEFCGTTQIANPSCPGGKSATRRTIGYYEGWGVGRACDAMLPEQIPVAAYTHINFAFAMIDPVSFAVAPMSDGDVELYSRVTGLKALYPDLEVWISIGGWSMNDPDQPTATTFSDLAGSTANQQKFFASLISFMSQYGFDGVDIDWEYPVAPERSGRPEDYENYPVFLQNLRNAFQAAGKSWGVTITMPSSFWYLQHFDIVKLEKVVDWFNMMEYDIHGTWDSTSVWTGAYIAAHTNLTEIDQSMKLLWRNGINPAKVVLGLGFYGRSYKLADPSCNKPGCVFTSGAPAGPCTESVGTLSYGEIQRLIKAGATPVLDSAAAVQMLTYEGDNWVSYDDETTLKMKVDYANENCLGGTMVWAASTDDPKGSAAAALKSASGGSLTLNTQLNIVLPSDNPGLCSWTRCGGSCPAGTTMAAYVLDGCPQPTASPFTYRLFCCPSNDVPNCNQRVQDLSGNVCTAGTCPQGTQLLTTTQFILFPSNLCPGGGHINWCCDRTKSMINTLGQCSWTDCGGSCPAGTTQMTQTLTGDGGDSPCTSGRRSLCCSTTGGSGFIPSTCGWYRNAYHDTCTPGCPQGKVQLAVDSAGANCARGFGSYCCDPPVNYLAGRSDPQVQSFKDLVHAFVTRGQCSAFTGPVRKRQFSSLLNPTSHDMAIRLAPMLYDWDWAESERKYITPFAQTWDDEVRANGDLLPSFDSLADSLANIDTSRNNAVDYLDRKLCNSHVTGTFDPIMCSSKKCSGGSACSRKRVMASVPDDITNEHFDTSAVTTGSDFTDPSTTHVDPTTWWQQAKNLDWWRGSNHGVDFLTGEEIASSRFVSFDQDPGRNLVTGAGPVWGCTTVAVVSNFGAWTAHFWQGFFEDDARFQQRVLDFLEPGNWIEDYPGLGEYTVAGGAFDLARTSFLSVVIMTPRAYQMQLVDPLLPPVIVPGIGPMYPTRVAAIQNRLDEIFGVATGSLNTIVHYYTSDQVIWDPYPSSLGVDASGSLIVHWSWRLDRSPRMVTAPYTGMMTIQRRAINVPGLAPAVRIYCGNTLEFSQTW